MENFTSLLLLVFKYNLILSAGILFGARLMEPRLFEELKDFYTLDFSEAEIASRGYALIWTFSIQTVVAAVLLSSGATFYAVVGMIRLRGQGFEKLQCLLISEGWLKVRSGVTVSK